MEKKETKIKDRVATGMSATAGAVVGVVAGSAIAQPASAHENPQPVQQSPTSNPSTSPTPPAPPAPKPPVPEPPTPPTPPNNPEPPTPPTPTQGPEVEVISCETVTNADGSEMEVAVVAIDGRPTVMADTDGDGVVDVIAVDENGNGTLEEHEIYTAISIDENGDGIVQSHEVHDIAEMQIEMLPLREAAGADTDMIAQNDIDYIESDYINNADVSDYMA